MKIRRIKLLIANGWFKTVCLVSYSLFSMLCSNASAQGQKNTPDSNIDSIIANFDKLSLDSINTHINGFVISNNYIMERNQGYRARAYGPQYPLGQYPLLVLDGNVIDTFSVDMQCLDSIAWAKVYFDDACAARLFGLKKRQIKIASMLSPSAGTAIWGQRGANGVIEVQTKRWYRKHKKTRKQEQL